MRFRFEARIVLSSMTRPMLRCSGTSEWSNAFCFLTAVCVTFALKLSEEKIELPATGVPQGVVPKSVPLGKTPARNDTELQRVALDAETDHTKAD